MVPFLYDSCIYLMMMMMMMVMMMMMMIIFETLISLNLNIVLKNGGSK